MPTQLKRTINLPLLVLYGLGTTVGAGFYALLGKVAGEAGMLAPLALAASGVLALLSALSFAELSSRFPFSAGEAMYVRQAFNQRWLSTLIGWLVITTGVVSAATLSTATVNFLQAFVELPTPIAVIIVVFS
ncbi:MAG: amino acid transporter, partial [Gammaproteobacteria bacterium]|nr:amino acid transporter [Gammaproteobacteria bacterium]